MHHEKSCFFICFLLKCIMVISLEMKTKVEMFMLNALLCHLCIHFAYFCWFWRFLALRGLYIFNTFLMILKLTSRADGFIIALCFQGRKNGVDSSLLVFSLILNVYLAWVIYVLPGVLKTTWDMYVQNVSPANESRLQMKLIHYNVLRIC